MNNRLLQVEETISEMEIREKENNDAQQQKEKNFQKKEDAKRTV